MTIDDLIKLRVQIQELKIKLHGLECQKKGLEVKIEDVTVAIVFTRSDLIGLQEKFDRCRIVEVE